MQRKKNTERQYFPYRFTKAMLILCIASLFLCLVGIGVSVFRMARYGVKDFNDFIRYPFLILICAFAIVVLVSLLIRSGYVVTTEYLYSNFGFLKSKTDIKKITSVSCDLQENKTTVRFGEDFCVLTLPAGEGEKLAKALLAVNPNIECDFTLDENESPDPDEKSE